MLYVVPVLLVPPATCNNWMCESVLSLSFESWSFFFITRQPREEINSAHCTPEVRNYKAARSDLLTTTYSNVLRIDYNVVKRALECPQRIQRCYPNSF